MKLLHRRRRAQLRAGLNAHREHHVLLGAGLPLVGRPSHNDRFGSDGLTARIGGGTEVRLGNFR